MHDVGSINDLTDEERAVLTKALREGAVPGSLMRSPRIRTDLPYPAGIVASRELTWMVRSYAANAQFFIDAAGDDPVRRSEAEVSWSLGAAHDMWLAAGAFIYDFPPALVAAFADTEFPLSGKDIPLPHGSFFVRVKGSSDLVIRHYGEAGLPSTPIDGFYVTSTRRLRTDLVGPESMPTDDAPEVLHILAVAIDPDGLYTHCSFADFSIRMDCENFEEAMVEALGYDDAMTGGNASEFVSWMRVCVAAAAYLAQEKPDMEKRVVGPTDRQRTNRLGNRAQRREFDAARLAVSYWRVGHRETVDRFYDAPEAQRALSRRFVVRGHYRQQPCGPGRKERKLLWIKPHYKGPDWATMASVHLVKVRP